MTAPKWNDGAPWHTDGTDDVFDANGNWIAMPFGYENGGISTRLCDARAQAIAALPDLYAALEKIAAIENQEWGSDWAEIDEARQIARAALAKAKGEGE